MPNVRSLNKDKYMMSMCRFRELYYFCLQYGEWKQEIQNLNMLSSSKFDGVPRSNDISDSTAKIAIKRAELSQKCELIENTAYDVDFEIAKYILKAVTEGANFNFLKTAMAIPCGRDRFYDSRRKFYWLLSRRL